ncbi:Crp/Fnr family transcriptional regulator [uncultured Croceicoccus sp.]|uniref:Crp/Fnr family transcriptional regulator n=1 Tax=uncultured Croceicoccus sp. TaxID=1295329 RepID=UPI0026145F3D|nr:Crp/Fnr family transcriptional regulator [uncultured Croceicoccus sp.]
MSRSFGSLEKAGKHCGGLLAMDRRMRPHLPDGHRWNLSDAILDTRRVQRDTQISFAQRMAEPLLHIEEGLAYSFTTLPDGRRHVEDLFGSGGVCNWKQSLRAALPYALMLKAGTTITRLDNAAVLREMERDPHLAEAFRRLDLSRQWRLRQRSRTLISGAIHDGLMHVLLDLSFETHGTFGRFDPMPVQMTQEEISTILGSSTVHVNRTVKKLVADGRLRRRSRVFEIVDPDRERQRLAYDTPSFPAIAGQPALVKEPSA